ncbi:DUF2249 domain-containing protein [Gracilimonas mengyeensis]|uniref:Uncharacterized conserved protein, DUF2249 family n=1 Tax=Gracilimonas mengyeensis TaxID=1302730 RepID=A0A521D1G1_9BACT|nr:DUF2249 domain-containing protein [Gracilimonas mengyeensis]SMO65535.1 Uncharacterized conserved protein, DUF2249 family [Gracilimonas mengyeensis]
MSAITENEIDVRNLIPIKRHEKLLKLFKELPAGGSFVFINDHDPKPLYYEFRSIFGDVVGWEYLERDPEEWKVHVTRTEASEGSKSSGISTLIDLRKTDKKDWKYTIFHRYGMMLPNDVMEIRAGDDPEEIHKIFQKKFEGEHSWKYKSKEEGEYVIHVQKHAENDADTTDITVVNKFDVRPHPPAKRHEMVFEAFDELKAGEAFLFINDHDPKPLYYQMEAENDVPFNWEYLQAMPGEWKVKVMKLKPE